MTEADAGVRYSLDVIRQRITDLSIVPDYKITAPEEAVSANQQLGDIKRIAKDVAQLKKDELAPLAQQEADIRDKFRPLEAMLLSAETTVKQALVAFQRAEADRIAAAQRAAQAAAAAEAARLAEAARREREKAEEKAAALREQGKDEKAQAVVEQAAVSAAAKEQLAAVMPASAAVAPAATALTGLSVSTVWKGEVTDLRRALAAMAADESLDLSVLVSVSKSGIDRLAALYKDKLVTKYPGLRGVPTDRVASRSK
jgi:hypothetical protein